MKIESPKIQTNVPGPGGQPGLLVIAPRNEALDWDIRYEVVSTSRYWMQDRQAWWIAAAYLHTAEEIVRRYAPQPLSVRVAAVTPPPAPESSPVLEPVSVPEPARLSGWARMLIAARGGWRGLETVFRRSWRASGSTDSA